MGCLRSSDVLLRLFAVFIFFAFLYAPHLPAAARGASEGSGSKLSLPRRVDAAIEHALKEERIVGTVVLVQKDGRLVYSRAAGSLDREKRIPMRKDAIFRLASMTKPLVSVAALALVDQGKLKLDDAVTKYLDFRPRLADGREPVITIRHLMTHTAGLDYGFMEAEDGPYHLARVSDGLDMPGLSLEENLSRIASVPLLYEPGSDWQYSVATDVLGAVLAKCAAQPLPELVESLVTGPLAMKDTAFFLPESKRSRLAVPYADGKPPKRMPDEGLTKVRFPGKGYLHFVPARLFDRASFASGGGGLVGTAADYLRFLNSIAGGGAPVLAKESGEAMLSSQTGPLKLKGQPHGWGFGYGYAVLVDREAARTAHETGTFKWGGAYGHAYFVDRKQKLIILIMTNTAVEGTLGSFPRQVRDAVYEVEVEP